MADKRTIDLTNARDRGRSKAERIARLRTRLDAIKSASPALAAIIHGILDLLADEL